MGGEAHVERGATSLAMIAEGPHIVYNPAGGGGIREMHDMNAALGACVLVDAIADRLRTFIGAALESCWHHPWECRLAALPRLELALRARELAIACGRAAARVCWSSWMARVVAAWPVWRVGTTAS